MAEEGGGDECARVGLDVIWCLERFVGGGGEAEDGAEGGGRLEEVFGSYKVGEIEVAVVIMGLRLEVVGVYNVIFFFFQIYFFFSPSIMWCRPVRGRCIPSYRDATYWGFSGFENKILIDNIRRC